MDIYQELWEKEIEPFTEKGLLCELWGHKAKDMNRNELLAFIGFLDEELTIDINNNKK